MRICTGDGSQKPRESDRSQGPKWKVKARANHILRNGKINQESSLRMRWNGPGEREGRKSSRPQWSERRANKIAVRNSERRQETKQFRRKKWPHWVVKNLGGQWSWQVVPRDSQQMKGSSYMAAELRHNWTQVLPWALSAYVALLMVGINPNSISINTRSVGCNRPWRADSLYIWQIQQKLLEGKAGTRDINCLAVGRWEREKGTASEAHLTRLSWTHDWQLGGKKWFREEG